MTDVALGHMTKMRWNDQGSWIYSEEIVQPPIISDDTFQQAQQLLAAKYRAALDAGSDPAVVGPWIAETQARKLAAEARLRAQPGTRPASPGQMSKEEITAIVNAITSLITVLRDADPQDKAEIYSQLGLRLTYHPSPRTVSARAEPGRPCTKGSCPRGCLSSGHSSRMSRDIVRILESGVVGDVDGAGCDHGGGGGGPG